MSAPRIVLALVLVAIGCKGGGGGSESSGSGEGSSSTGAPTFDGCQSVPDADGCAAAAAMGCAWFDVLHVERHEDTCTLLDAFGVCLPAQQGGDGCVSPSGCEPAEDPFIWIQPDGTAWSMTTCGGVHPTGWMHCESGSPDAEPPVCNCACSLAT